MTTVTSEAGRVQVEKSFPHSVYVPYDRGANWYETEGWNGGGDAEAWEYTGWRDETMSWKTTCYIHGHLNPTPTFVLRGPGALKLLSDTCVNSFAKFSIGGAKHAAMCNRSGQIMVHGMVLRLAEEEFITYWLAPWLPYLLQKDKGKYDVEGEDLTGKVFLFQIAGPRSLEVLEVATADDLHDIRFIRHRKSSIDGMEVNVLRIGMAGTLAYELHGRIDHARPVYRAVEKAGEPYGIRRLGIRAYMMNHTENGFPQSYYHFPVAWGEDQDFVKYLGQWGGLAKTGVRLRGSMGTDIQARYRNPVELGWANLIKFDHEFIGRAALETEVANPRRKMVTLVWNTEDIIDVYASQFRPGEPYRNMDDPNHFGFEVGDKTHALTLYADQVLKDGRLVGISSGRAYSYYYREMLSLCSIDVSYGDIGTEVVVLWGDPGTRQKEIRATVSRFPYLDENRNEAVDVSKIPCPIGKPPGA